MRVIELKWIAFLAGVLPTLAGTIAYFISVSTGQVDLCNPFFEGCVSISRAARKEPSLMVFRAIMIPSGVTMMLFWFFTYRWLRQTGDDSQIAPRVVCIVGLIGGLFLILYSTYLGTDGDIYKLLRRYGITIFFAFTYLAQLMLTRRIQILGQADKLQISIGLYRMLVGLGAMLLFLGLISLPIQHVFDLDSVENMIEWNFGLLMCGYFVLYFFVWDATGFTAQTSVRTD